MVFYFSGTGNSRFVARQIADAIEDDLKSINACLQKGEKCAFFSERPFVFVLPTYAWRMPKVVERWIVESAFSGNRDAYFVLTCGGGCGNAAAYAQRLCAQKRWRFCGLAPVRMPENYLALFPTPDEAQCAQIIEEAKPRVAELAERIRSGARLEGAPISLRDRLESGPVNPLFYALFVRDKGFHVSDRCVSCGKCAKQCPLNNIRIAEGRPVWNGRCTHCMACIALCPTQAIAYKSQSKGRHHHYIPDESLSQKDGG